MKIVALLGKTASWAGRRSRARAGQSMVEFAFVLPIFLLLALGTFEVGRMVYLQSSLENAAREAARACRIDGAVETEVAEQIARVPGLGSVALALDPDCCGDCDYGTNLSVNVSLPDQTAMLGVFPSLTFSLSAAAAVRVE